MVKTLLVSYDSDNAVLIVGSKNKKRQALVDIVNAFQDEEAHELYKKLTEKEMDKIWSN